MNPTEVLEQELNHAGFTASPVKNPSELHRFNGSKGKQLNNDSPGTAWKISGNATTYPPICFAQIQVYKKHQNSWKVSIF